MSGGAVAAVVREVDASQGRVRVEYVQIEDGLESPWAYVAVPLAGPSRGMLFMPEPGDEVLVIHGNNDFDYPYVVGYLWNGRQRAPETEAHMRVIKTPGGHQLRFEDKEGAKKVILKSEGNRSATLDDQPGLGKIELKSGGNLIVLDDNPAATQLKLQAGTGVGVTITMSATPVPSLSISVGPSTTIKVDASGTSLQTTSATLMATAALTITAPVLTLNSALVSVSGVLQCASLVSPVYTPGVGNLL